jgi:hypothetical protein
LYDALFTKARTARKSQQLRHASFLRKLISRNFHSDLPYDISALHGPLQAFAEHRVRSVAQVLDSLSLVSGESLEGRDLAYIAHLAARVLEEGCEVIAVMQKRLAQQAT